MKKNTWVVLLSFLSLLSAANIHAADAELSAEDRLARLERLVNSNALVDVMVRVESIQSEMQRLVGEIELQKHTLEEIKKRQRDLYLDIDRRLLQIERRSGSAGISSAPAVNNQPVTNVPPQVTTTVATTPGTETSPVTSGEVKDKEGEQVAYQKAFDLLRALRYEKATLAFRQFLMDYPNGRYAHIAQYWLAETSYHTRKFDIAVKDYQTLINKYPKSPKRADALLKIGYSQFELNFFAESKAVLEKLIQSYPGTTEAGQAENLLQKIRLQKLQ